MLLARAKSVITAVIRVKTIIAPHMHSCGGDFNKYATLAFTKRIRHTCGVFIIGPPRAPIELVAS